VSYSSRCSQILSWIREDAENRDVGVQKTSRRERKEGKREKEGEKEKCGEGRVGYELGNERTFCFLSSARPLHSLLARYMTDRSADTN